jgi:hypothetical protein
LQQLFQQAQQPSDFQALATKIFDARIGDTRFVLDQLAALNRGANPDAEGGPFPRASPARWICGGRACSASPRAG